MKPDAILHPGSYIKESVLPPKISVTKAAELLGVGRPALSNLLNGNAALTSEMALRLEKAFGAKAQELLHMQTAYDESQGRAHAKEIAVRTYVPSFLKIGARQISAWAAGHIEARATLPAFLRRLVHSTGEGLTKVDFPAFDNSQRHGWDGYVSAEAASPWIPRGNSGWEFGCNQRPAVKAEGDFQAKSAATDPQERSDLTFVFVTPHNWPGKEAWAKEKRTLGLWKDVRAYDGSDIEQWLEQSVATQIWFSEVLGNDVHGILSLERCWTEWANASTPPLSKILFRASIAAEKTKLESWLSNPPAAPFIVTADSEGEALAFVACAFEECGTIRGEFRDNALVFNDAKSFQRTASVAPNLVAVVKSPDTETAVAPFATTHHILIVRRRNDVFGEANVTLDLVDDTTYREALEDMGLHHPDYQRYAKETANSPTILRRRFSTIPAIRAPAWAVDKELAKKLLPLNFAGAWDSGNNADKEIVRCLADSEYDVVEQNVAELRAVADAPMWSFGRYRGVTSKIDVLFATHQLITPKQLDDFLTVAQFVLSETDPALDLPADKQWAANIYGKSREHSAVLRRGLCETLVLLAVHGDNLLREHLGVDVQQRVNALVRQLLLPLDERTWASQRGDLPRYAEAAPEVFLDILEQDLGSPQPKVHALMQPADNALFGGCPRTGLLWALETLAWKPERLLRASLILTRLAELHVKDNWGNKPEASLAAIYCCWMPQTAATIEERNAAMEIVCQRYPDIGWALIIDQFNGHHTIGHYNSRPQWRNDASGAGQPIKMLRDVYPVAQKALRLALAWPTHSAQTLGDLVACVRELSDEDQETVWQLVRDWAASDANDTCRHELREKVRTSAFTRRARIRGVSPQHVDRAREAYALLAPRNLVTRHLWLFEKHWVDESSDEIDDDNFDYNKREERIAALRKTAIAEIWDASGFDGIMRLCELSEARGVIGWQLADVLSAQGGIEDVLNRTVGSATPANIVVDNFLLGFLQSLGSEKRRTAIDGLLKEYLDGNDVNKAIRLLKCAPFRAETWNHLALLPGEWQKRYWEEVYARWEDQDESEFDTAVTRLVDVGRPRAAFSVVHIAFDKVAVETLATLLRAVATSSNEPSDHFRLAHYDVAEAFKSLKKRSYANTSDLAQLEFMYVDALEHSDYGIPTLERAIGEDELLFMQLVALVYRRSDGNEDPPEWVVPEHNRQNVATNAYGVLRRLHQVPGKKDGTGTPSAAALKKWIDNVRTHARFYGRDTVIDTVIGEVLGRCPLGDDGIWPCEPVRVVLDTFASREMAHGVSIGRNNERGAHFRSPKGDDERALAAQYRTWAKAVSVQYPYTAQMLEEMATGYDREAHWHDTEENVRKRVS